MSQALARAIIFIIFILLIITSATATGSLVIERHGEHMTLGIQTAPYAQVGVNSPSTAVNPATFSNIDADLVTVVTADVVGLVESAGTCTHAVGSTCTVSTFNLDPVCGSGICSLVVPITDNQVTKVAFKFEGIYEGFANSQNVPGAKQGQVLHVTNTQASGAGSFANVLQTACQQGNSYIVFDVGGEIEVNKNLRVCGVGITIDGFTSPTPITLRRTGLELNVLDEQNIERNTQNVIIRGLTIRKENDKGSEGYDDKGIQVQSGGSTYFFGGGTQRVKKIILANNALSGATDDMLAFAREVQDFTLVENIFGEPIGQTMIMQEAWNFTIARNLYSGYMRNPMFAHHNPPSMALAPGLSADMRNNLVAITQNPTGVTMGTVVTRGSSANVVNNFYILRSSATGARAKHNSIIVCNPGSQWGFTGASNYCGDASETYRVKGAYVNGNKVESDYHPTVGDLDLDLRTTVGSAYVAPSVRTVSADQAACEVLVSAGTGRPDSQDVALLLDVRKELEKFITCEESVVDPTAPSISLTRPSSLNLSGLVTVVASASDTVGVVGVQFLLDGTALQPEDLTAPYSFLWDTATVSNGDHVLMARARDAAGNVNTAQLTVNIDNAQTELKKASAYETLSSPVIDGDLVEFTNVPSVSINGPQSTGVYRFLYDDVNLYVGATITDTQLNSVVMQRDGNLFGEDSLEIMFDVANNDGNQMTTGDYKFVINLLNAQYDAHGLDASYNAVFDSYVVMIGTNNNNLDVDTSYSVELSIPWAAMGVVRPAVGSIWGIDMSLNDRSASGATQTAWADLTPTTGGFNDPNGWGDLEFHATKINELVVDLNADGGVNILDIILLVNHVLGDQPYRSDYDFTGDLVIDIRDVFYLVGFL